MDDSLQKIVAASHPFFQVFYYVMGVLLQKMLDFESILLNGTVKLQFKF